MLISAFAFLLVGAVDVPPYGGRLEVGFTDDMVSSLNVAKAQYQTFSSGCAIWPLIYDQMWLCGPTPNYAMLPSLATHWEVDNGGKSFIYHMRTDAKFHDGVNVTAEDAVFTYLNLPQVEIWWYPDIDVASAVALDTYTVNVTLTHPNRTPAGYWFPILPKHIWQDHMTPTMDTWEPSVAEVIGSGPFKVKEFDPANWILLEANTEYWGGRPFVDEILMKFYSTTETFNAALAIGDPGDRIDMSGYGGISPEFYDDFNANPNVDIEVIEDLPCYGLAFNLYDQGAPGIQSIPEVLMDRNVREAIYRAVNRTEILELVYLGWGEEIDSWMYRELTGWYNTTLPQYEYNLTRANEILDAAGYLDTDEDGTRNDYHTGKELEFELCWPSTLATLNDLCAMVIEDIELLDIAITPVPVDYATYTEWIYWPEHGYTQIFIVMEEPAIIFDWYWLFCTQEGIDVWWNCAYYSDATLDALYLDFKSATSEAEAMAACQAMLGILAEDIPYAYLIRPTCLSAQRNDKFAGYVFTVGGASNWINHWSYVSVRKVEYDWEGWDTDVNLDGKVNVKDIFAVAKIFGANAGPDSNFAIECDINLDAKINVKDIFATAKNFGKQASWA
jgi:peptide/nickel transport system substrate-binding protein